MTKSSGKYFLLTALAFLFPFFALAYLFFPGLPVLAHGVLLFNGWLFWTLVEYFWHRYKMHPGPTAPRGRAFKEHRYHHEHPNDLQVRFHHRMLMLVGIVLLGAAAIRLDNYFTFIYGIYLGFVWFCYVHILLHRRWSAYFFPKLLNYHIHHHSKLPNVGYGVSVTWWDDIYGTIPPESSRISERVIELYFRGL